MKYLKKYTMDHPSKNSSNFLIKKKKKFFILRIIIANRSLLFSFITNGKTFTWKESGNAIIAELIIWSLTLKAQIICLHSKIALNSSHSISQALLWFAFVNFVIFYYYYYFFFLRNFFLAKFITRTLCWALYYYYECIL